MMNKLGHEVDHSLPSSVKAENEWCCTITLPVCIRDMGWDNFFLLVFVIHLKTLTNFNTTFLFIYFFIFNEVFPLIVLILHCSRLLSPPYCGDEYGYVILLLGTVGRHFYFGGYFIGWLSNEVLLVIVFLKICMYGHDIFHLLNLKKLCYFLLFCTSVVLDGYKSCYVISSSRMLWICMFRYVNFLSIFIWNKAFTYFCMHLHVFTEEYDWPDFQLNDIIELRIFWNIPLSEVWAFIGRFMIFNFFLEVDGHLKLVCILMEDILSI
jgi:hypothetical protein